MNWTDSWWFWTVSESNISMITHIFFFIKLNFNPKSFDLITSMLMIYWALSLVFCCCELGELVTNQFNMFDNELCRCDWYLLPIEVQRIFVIVMANAQNLMIIRGYGNIVCTRNAFKEVKFIFLLAPYRNKGVKYYFEHISDDAWCFFLFYDASSNRCMNVNHRGQKYIVKTSVKNCFIWIYLFIYYFLRIFFYLIYDLECQNWIGKTMTRPAWLERIRRNL